MKKTRLSNFDFVYSFVADVIRGFNGYHVNVGSDFVTFGYRRFYNDSGCSKYVVLRLDGDGFVLNFCSYVLDEKFFGCGSLMRASFDPGYFDWLKSHPPYIKSVSLRWCDPNCHPAYIIGLIRDFIGSRDHVFLRFVNFVGGFFGGRVVSVRDSSFDYLDPCFDFLRSHLNTSKYYFLLYK